MKQATNYYRVLSVIVFVKINGISHLPSARAEMPFMTLRLTPSKFSMLGGN